MGVDAENPVKLKVTGKIYAGDYLDIQVRSGEAIRIMTGAMIPVGADCVLRQEDVYKRQILPVSAMTVMETALTSLRNTGLQTCT